MVRRREAPSQTVRPDLTVGPSFETRASALLKDEVGACGSIAVFTPGCKIFNRAAFDGVAVGAQ
jgi:hypothetical protein